MFAMRTTVRTAVPALKHNADGPSTTFLLHPGDYTTQGGLGARTCPPTRGVFSREDSDPPCPDT